MLKVCVRYAPSPTGVPHIGNIRTALFNFLFAKNQKGKFILRIEDTDQKRSTIENTQKIKESLKVLNLSWDKEYLQSERLNVYNKHLEILKKNGFVQKDGNAWRFNIKTQKQKVGWEDIVHGHVEFPAKVIEDFIIVKSDTFPTYHFASVVDDHLMKVSHVLRGDEWISSTPKHLLLYEAFGWEPPKFVHLPSILGQDKKKLSKREGAKSILEYIDEGYLAETIVNFLALLGWASKSNQEIFSLSELIKEFSMDRINKNSPIFNIENLNWFNGQWIRKLDVDKLAAIIKDRLRQYDEGRIKEYLPLVKDRMATILDFQSLTSGFFKAPDVSKLPQLLIGKGTVTQLIQNYEAVDKPDWAAGTISNATSLVMESEKVAKSEMYRSIGIATLASTVTPPLIESLEKLGKEETIKRLKNATKKAK